MKCLTVCVQKTLSRFSYLAISYSPKANTSPRTRRSREANSSHFRQPLLKLAVPIAIFISVVFCESSFCADHAGDAQEYVIGSGDVIQISVWQYEQFNSTATVGPDGKITLHLLGDITVAGLTRHEVKEDVAERLSKFIKEGAEVTVSIVQFNSQKISVFGQVRNPRTISFSSIPSLLEVMIQSVPTSEADLTEVMIIPEDASVRDPITVNMARVLETGDTSHLPKLHPGDTIYVPKIETVETSTEEVISDQPGTISSYTPSEPSQSQKGQFVIHVMGAVARPGSFTASKEVTITEALLQAGSVSESTALKDIRIIRGGPALGDLGLPSARDRVVHVDFDRYLSEGDPSLLPKLYSGDTIYVPDMTQGKMKDVSITITGRVVRPGSYKTREPLDILDAISMAGGLTPDADPERIRIRRETDDSYQEKVVNIEEFLEDVASTSPPEMVGPGYRIYVPARERPAASVVAFGARGVVAFLADLIPIYGMYRWIRD